MRSDWHRIGIGLAPDWYQIGLEWVRVGNNLALVFASDWRWVGIEFGWICNELTSDWLIGQGLTFDFSNTVDIGLGDRWQIGQRLALDWH